MLNNIMMLPSTTKSKKRRQITPLSFCPTQALTSMSTNCSDSLRSSRDSLHLSNSSSSSSSSSSIPIPKSHIHRTPSELQLADEVRRAEHDDVRMYARLLTGMQHQLQRDYRANGGVVHPLSRMSLQGIVKTKLAAFDEIDGELYFQDADNKVVQHLPWSARLVRDGISPSQSNSECSLSTLDSFEAQYNEDELFVFDLEL